MDTLTSSQEIDPFKGMWVSGWITSTQTIDGIVHYGPFTSRELALEWGKQLNNVEVYRTFHPVHNAGQEHHDNTTEGTVARSFNRLLAGVDKQRTL